MRIINGNKKGRLFRPPGNFKGRPTTDYAKEALFNILRNRFDFTALQVLDLFSGTGAISFEFASLDCKEVIAIEIDPVNFRGIQKNIMELGFSQIKVYRADMNKALTKLKPGFDVIFADPPFDLKWFEEVPEIVLKHHLLNDDGVFILEHSHKVSFNKHPNLIEFRQYGKVCFSFFK